MTSIFVASVLFLVANIPFIRGSTNPFPGMILLICLILCTYLIIRLI